MLPTQHATPAAAKSHDSPPAAPQYVGPPDERDDDQIQRLLQDLLLLKDRGMDIDMFFDQTVDAEGRTTFELNGHLASSLQVSLTNSRPAARKRSTHVPTTVPARGALGSVVDDEIGDMCGPARPRYTATYLEEGVQMFRVPASIMKSHVCVDGKRIKYNLNTRNPPATVAATPQTPAPSATRDTVGGIASVYANSTTFISVFLPHFAANVRLGIGLCALFAHIRQVQTDLKSQLPPRASRLTIQHRLFQTGRRIMCARFGVPPNEFRSRLEAMHLKMQEQREEHADIGRLVRKLRDLHHAVLVQFLARNARFVILPRFTYRSLGAGAEYVPTDSDDDMDEDENPDHFDYQRQAQIRRDVRDLALRHVFGRLPKALAMLGVGAWTVSDANAVGTCGGCGAVGEVGGRVYECGRCGGVFHRDENAARNMLVRFFNELHALDVDTGIEIVQVPLAEAKLTLGARRRVHDGQ